MNLSQKERYENGWLTDVVYFKSSPAAIKLGCNNTGMWLIGDISDIAKNGVKGLSSGKFYYEFFNEEDNCYMFNQNVIKYENNSLIPLGASRKLILSIKSAFIREDANFTFKLIGHITIKAKLDDVETISIMTIPYLTLASNSRIIPSLNPFDVIVPTELTMNSVDLFDIRNGVEFGEVFSFGFDEEEEVSSKAPTKSIMSRFMIRSKE